jgi:hypothetical protein
LHFWNHLFMFDLQKTEERPDLTGYSVIQLVDLIRITKQ